MSRSSRLLLVLVLVAAATVAGCGGGDAPPAGPDVSGPTTPTAKGAKGAKPAATPGAKAGPFVIERATRLLPSTPQVDAADAARGFEISAGEGLPYTERQPLSHRGVDRLIRGGALVRDSVSVRLRDTRPALVLRVADGTDWKSPLVRLPAKSKLYFSYKPYLEGMGGYTNALSWRAFFEVPGKDGSKPSRVEIWRRDDFLRPPTGGVWKEVELDLAELGNRTGRVVLSARVAPGGAADVPPALISVFGNPMIVPESDRRPNLLIISIDTLRRDAISPYGADPARTPNVQRLADRGVVLDQFWTTAPWTLPAYASLFTAEYPSTHGASVDRTGLENLGDKPRGEGTHNERVRSIATGIPSLVSHFAELGYTTQAFYANGHLNVRSGIERGFDGFVWFASTGSTGTEAFDQWAESVEERPFFAFVQMMDPHWPYTVPRSFERKYDVVVPDVSENESMRGKPVEMFIDSVPEQDRQDMIDTYDILVTYMDTQVGAILDTLERRGLSSNTLVVFHVDHGEEFWDHGEWWHGHTHFAELEHVPGIFSWPGVLPEGTRVREQFRGIDVLPTAIDLLGLPTPEHETEGRSFAHFLRGEPGEAPPPALQEGELYGQGGGYGLVEYPWRLVVQPMARWLDRETWAADQSAAEELEFVRLFNIEDDPKERNDLAALHPDRVKRMRALAETIRTAARGRQVGESLPTEMGPHAYADLGVLGY
jgi:arylsulfatase A-like enzyme